MPYGHIQKQQSFPTRRSSDLFSRGARCRAKPTQGRSLLRPEAARASRRSYSRRRRLRPDRKSTRLNSSHVETSYAVFCLKKKKHCATDCDGKGTEQTKSGKNPC